ncbi:hypothetical protein XANCAGTX0491_003462 [Xanthoria calcicola]
MATSHDGDAAGHESHIPNHKMEQANRKAKKQAARRERGHKSRQSKWMAREAAKTEAGDVPAQGPVPKQHKQVGNKQTADWAMIQARRWLQNERRKLDTGGLTPDGIAGFVRWTRQGDGYDWAPSEQCEDANVAIKRFLDEMKAARQARNKTSNMKDWWKVEPPHPASARRKWARENVGRSKAKKGAESAADGSGGPPMGMDVDQMGHELAAGGVRDGSELLDPVSAEVFGIPAHEGKHMQGHADDNENDTMPKQLKLPLRLGKPKVGEAGEHDIHDMGPDSVTCQASDKVEGSDSDIDDMAPEPVLRADYEEDENTMWPSE